MIKKITHKKWKPVVLDNTRIPQKIKNKLQERYLISNDGQVKNRKTKKLLKGTLTKNGYLRIDLSYNGYRYSFFVHRLVALAFLPAEEKQLQSLTIHHKDKNKTNNNVMNLQWLNRQEHGKLTQAERKKANGQISESKNSND